jgi:hypothetical protein
MVCKGSEIDGSACGEGGRGLKDIRFRAWDKNSKGFINGFNMIGFSTGQGAPYKKLARYDTQWAEEDFELMQFTGMKDFKRTAEYPEGQPIFEGDIVEVYTDYNQETHTSMVQAKDGAFCAGLLPLWHLARNKSSINVIGNIYQNPEALLIE